MSDNPLEPNPQREARIRERAYHLWEADGRPHGRDSEYWERAKELIGMEDHPGAALEPNPMTLDEPIPGVTVEEAAIQENYGEAPERFTDQGERRQTPMTRDELRTGTKPRRKPAAEKRPG